MMPISFAETRLNETARIARPVFVRYTIICKAIISTSAIGRCRKMSQLPFDMMSD